MIMLPAARIRSTTIASDAGTKSLKIGDPNVVRTGTFRENLRYRVVQVSTAGGKHGAARALAAKREELSKLEKLIAERRKKL